MIDTSAVLTTALVCGAAIISPGPNFVAITHRAVTATRSEALTMAAGVACISALWAAAALFGLGLIFTLFPWLFWSVKLLGAAYLVWLGIKLLHDARLELPDRPAVSARSSLARAFRDGAITNLSNPKAMVFYGSVFSAFVPLNTTLSTQATMIATVGMISLLWYGSVAWLLAGSRAAGFYRRSRPIIEGACGLLLLALGVRQALPSQ